MRERIRFEKEIELLSSSREYEVLFPDHTESLDRFLRREKDLQQWRILALLKCGALELTRAGAKSTLTKPDEKLKDKDALEIKDPLPFACDAVLKNIPEADYSDYAYGPPSPADDYEKGVNKYLTLHSQMIVLSGLSVTTLDSFIRALKKDDRVTRPIRYLVVASHASHTGRLKVQLLGGSSLTEINFEDLEAAVKAKQLEVDATLLEPRPKDAANKAIPAMLHIKGCNIGNPIASPFLQLLKTALGGKIGVTAPKFFHTLKTLKKSGKLVELWEFFSYEFVLFRTSALANKKDAVAAFKAATGFQRIDGSAVPKSDWEKWIPSSLPSANNVAKVNVAIKSALSTNSKNIEGQFRYQRVFYSGKQWGKISLPKDPGTDALRKDEIKKQLVNSNPRYQASHPFPMYARLGFKSIDEYFDSYDWKFKAFDAKALELPFSGTRHEYTVVAPIVDPTNNQLFMNLFPASGAPTIQIVESDARFFSTV